MEEKKKLTREELEEIYGGTYGENFDLLIALGAAGHGIFLRRDKVNNADDTRYDYEGMKAFFAEKGYKFVPGYGNKPNVFIDSEGLPYGNDYIIYLIRNDKL